MMLANFFFFFGTCCVVMQTVKMVISENNKVTARSQKVVGYTTNGSTVCECRRF